MHFFPFQTIPETNEEVDGGGDVSCDDEPGEEGAFEILGADDDTQTKGAETNEEEAEQMTLLPSDHKMNSLIPMCRTDHEMEVERENIVFDVAAGIRVLVPVVVPGSHVDLSWEFTSSPKVSDAFWYKLLW